MSVDMQACTRREPTPEMIQELATACGVPGARVLLDAYGDWPGTIETDDGAVCFLEAPEVLADSEDVDDLVDGAEIAPEELPLWLVTLTTPADSGQAGSTVMTALAEGIVTRCGGWAYCDGDLVATGPDRIDDAADAPSTPLSFFAVTSDPPTAELVGKVRERHVLVGEPAKVESDAELAAFIGTAEAASIDPPVWVTELTADPTSRASSPLTLAVGAAEFVMNGGADVFDRTGHRLPLPPTLPAE
ncbi:MAG: hypothetical protein GEV10_01470 [Streptosporangiales bacterium]|nr:hypothetical protein [Streptosporangiales bacterium]